VKIAIVGSGYVFSPQVVKSTGLKYHAAGHSDSLKTSQLEKTI
jgi:hypothetical protein